MSDGSIFSDSSLWTESNLGILEAHFIDHPIVGDQSFLEKFRQQLEPTSSLVKQLAAEMLWLLLLFPSNIGGPKKRENIREVWSWSGEKLSDSNPMLAILDHGIGGAGQAFNQRRDLELTFAIRMIRRWKKSEGSTQLRLIESPWTFGTWVDGIADASNRGFRHMILFLLFPDSYERIATIKHKNAIVASFVEFKDEIPQDQNDSMGVARDKRLYSIRKALEGQRVGEDVDFYRTPIREMWQPLEVQETEDGETAYPSEMTQSQQESEMPNRVWIEKTLVKGRPDREKGEHRLGSALWSPQKSKSGIDIYKNMRELREGDVVLHLIDNQHFSGVSLVAGTVDSNFQGLPNTAWEGPAYRVALRDYTPLNPPLEREEFLDSPIGAAELRKVHEKYRRGLFYTTDLDLNQGKYLTRAPIELAQALSQIYFSLHGHGIPHIENLLSTPKQTGIYDSYSEDDAMEGIFLDRGSFNELLDMLRKKKNLILQGPPGVGKTFIARRLANALLKADDRRRMKFVQFHQSYSYEDFIEGYRPNDEGGFAIRKGLFRNFCQMALDDSGRDYVPLRANIRETPVVLLINEQGEKEKGRDEREFSWCSFFGGFGWRGTERRRAKRAAAQWSGSQSGRRLPVGLGSGFRSGCQTQAAHLYRGVQATHLDRSRGCCRLTRWRWRSAPPRRSVLFAADLLEARAGRWNSRGSDSAETRAKVQAKSDG